MTRLEYLPLAWETRLVVMRDVFPWITPAIKELAGLAPHDDLSSTESQVAFLQSHSEYTKGTMASNPRSVELHHRQNAEWEKLTGIGPLGTSDDWRAAGHAANAPEDAIRQCDVKALARFISPWAIALRTSSTAGMTRCDANDDNGHERESTETTQGNLLEIVNGDFRNPLWNGQCIPCNEKQARVLERLIEFNGGPVGNPSLRSAAYPDEEKAGRLRGVFASGEKIHKLWGTVIIPSPDDSNASLIPGKIRKTWPEPLMKQN